MTDQGADRRTSRLVAGGLLLSVAGSVGFLFSYWGDAGTQAEGASLGVALGGLAVAAGVWGLRAVPERVAIERRDPMPSGEADRAAAAEAAQLDETGTGRRRTLLGLIGMAGAGLAAALVSPLRSLGPSPSPELETTAWRSGRRLVDSEGRPVRVGDLDVDSILTAFPEGARHEAAGDSQVILVRLSEGSLRLPDDRQDWAPRGHVAYSKVCTHAGCPVGLYEAETQELYCPCHQSTFQAAEGARVTFGPAARPLPQLPLGVDDEGHFIALADFSEPIGPSYWSRP